MQACRISLQHYMRSGFGKHARCSEMQTTQRYDYNFKTHIAVSLAGLYIPAHSI